MKDNHLVPLFRKERANGEFKRGLCMLVGGKARGGSMAEQRFKKLRATGALGSFLANVLSILTTQWAVALSAATAIVTGSVTALRDTMLLPGVYVGVGVFVAVLWTSIGICALIDRRKPRIVTSNQDYRYGLTFEGMVPHFSPVSSAIASQRGAMGFAFQIKNYSPGPIQYAVELVDIRIGSRTIPKLKPNELVGFMPRGGGKVIRPGGFRAGSLKEFYGKGETKGTVDIAFVYGAPDEPPVRRLRMSIETTFFFPAEKDPNPVLGFIENLVFEKDEPI